MSHWCTLVILPKEFVTENIETEVARLLAPYDQNLEIEPYIQWMGEGDIRVMKEEYKVSTLEELLPYMEDWNHSPGILEDGKLGYWDTYNYKCQWDNYTIGGGGCKEFLPTNPCLVSEISENFVTVAIVTPDGGWHEYDVKNKQGWFLVVGENIDESQIIYMTQIRRQFGDHLAVIVDCHI